jgi:hypothetical protein
VVREGSMDDDLMMDWANVPVLALTFGDAGIGKTTDMVFTMPGALFLASATDNIRSAGTVMGVNFRRDQIVEVRTLSDCFPPLMAILDQRQRGETVRYTGVVPDDVSMLAANELAVMQASGKYKTKKEGSYDRQIWSDLATTLADLIGLIRYDLELPAGVTAHARAGEDHDGQFEKGGPDMPAKKMIRRLPHAATCSYRCTIDSTYKGEHKGIYDATHPSFDWHTKCRNGWNGMLPMNLAECLRNAPLPTVVPRHPDVAWIEPWVKGAHQALMEGKSGVAEAIDAKLNQLRAGTIRQHRDWIIRDAIARTILVKKKNETTLSSRWGV